MKKDRILNIMAISLIAILSVSCGRSFLEYTPKGVLTSNQIDNPENADKMVTAAYASLGNDDWSYAFSHMWIWGGVRSDDAYKGGGSVADQGEIDIIEQFVAMRTDVSKPDLIWTAIYEGIGRANDALSRINQMDESVYPQKRERAAECRFLRGHFYFLLVELFKMVPYVDETIEREDTKSIKNDLSQDELWNKIADDFRYAANNLPTHQSQIGRANRYAALAYLAKVRLYQAYEQDNKNQVININKSRLSEVIDLSDSVIVTGQYGLNEDFAFNFLPDHNNSKESIFAVQFSYDDGTSTPGRINKATGLNYNMAPQYGCCDFYNPSQDLVNAFRTSDEGLPYIDSYNSVRLKDSIDFWNNTIDPRLDHTVGIATHSFKYLPNFVMEPNWRRAPFVYGTFSSMKEIVQYTDPSYHKYGAFMGGNLNFTVLRYDDLLLMKAEALIELNREDEALPIINKIRERAANSTQLLKLADDSFNSNYKISDYRDGVNCDWTQSFARAALRFERRLEFAMEGMRFFDLVRWGIASETLNSYFQNESAIRSFLSRASFTKERDEYLPIPENQITLVDGIYDQNNGW